MIITIGSLLVCALLLALILWITCSAATAAMIIIHMKNTLDQTATFLLMQAIIATFGAYSLIQAIINIIKTV